MAKDNIKKRQRPGRIFRQRKIDEAMGEIIRGQTIRFLVDRRYFDKLQFHLPDNRNTFERSLILLSNALRGLFQVNSVYDQMVVSYRMAQRYPWNPRLIKRSEHLHFVWMVFVNLCYLVEERFKLAAEAHNAAVVAFKSGARLKTREGVERIVKGLRQHIQARGEFTHQWRTSHDIIRNYQTIELAHLSGGMPKGFKLRGTFGLSRMLIVMEMKRALPIVEDVLLQLIDSHKGSLLPISSHVTEALKRLELEQEGKGKRQ